MDTIAVLILLGSIAVAIYLIFRSDDFRGTIIYLGVIAGLIAWMLAIGWAIVRLSTRG